MRASPRSRRRPRGAALCVLLALAGVACAPGSNTTTATKSDTPAIGRSSAPSTEPSDRPATTERKRARDGTLVVTVTDHGRRRSRVPVTFRLVSGGPRTRLLTEDGVVRIDLRPGLYDVEVPIGCFEDLIVQRGARGRATVEAGATLRVPFEVNVERRYAPGAPDSTPDAPWPDGATVRLRFTMFDEPRCDSGPASNIRYGYMRWEPSDNLEVLGGGLRTDDDGYATVRIRCLGPGDASLVLVDPEAPGEGVDLLALATPSPYEPELDWCA